MSADLTSPFSVLRWMLVLALLLSIVILLVRVATDLDHIRRQQCYTPAVDHGERVYIYMAGCR